MRQLPVGAEVGRTRAMKRDLLLAMAVGCFFSAAWAIADWAKVGRLILPDTDDMMRLAQVRDWLAGQAFDDWTQYRAAPPQGASMHWSRLGDLGPAALILALTPLVGRHGAELGMVIAYPAILFCCHLFLSARIARRLWSSDAGPIAVVLAALAYPGTTIFLPGRIDHHALQMLLVEAAALAIMRGPSDRNGVLAGACFATSLAIGLETAPHLAALACVLFTLWILRGEAERGRLAGFGGALIGVTGFALATLRPTYWSAALCDAFTPASSTGTLAGGALLIALAAATPKLRDVRTRLVLGGASGAAVLGGLLSVFPACLEGPYGTVDPFLHAIYMPYIGEARGVFAQGSAAIVIGFGGLITAGAAATLWMVARRSRRWPVTTPVAAVILVSATIAVAQIRGLYIGLPLTAPVLAGAVTAARRRPSGRLAAVAATWIMSTGHFYFLVSQLVADQVGSTSSERGATKPDRCETGEFWDAMNRYPTGVVMTAVDHAAYLVGATKHSTVGAGYHRHNRGNVAMYRYFLSRPEQAAPIARAWSVDYVLFCPGDFSEVDITRRYPRSLGAMLAAGRAPAGWKFLPLGGSRARFYRIGRR